MKDTDVITVCDKCFTAACWHGELMCMEAIDAGVVEKTVEELKELKREASHHWERQLKECG